MKISTVEGGISCARVAEAPITPVASLGSYPARSMVGRLIRLMVITTAPTTPVEAARMAPTMTTA